MTVTTEIENLNKLLTTNRKRLAILLEQVTIHGWAYAPPVKIIEITENRNEIARIKTELRRLGEKVRDEANDEATEEERLWATAAGRRPNLLYWLQSHNKNKLPPEVLRELADCILSCSSFLDNKLDFYSSIESLVAFLVDNEENQETKQKLCDKIESIFGYGFPFPHLLKLISLLPEIQLEPGTIRDAYKRSAPKGTHWNPPIIQDSPQLLEDSCYILAKASTQHDKSSPLLNFLLKITDIMENDNPIVYQLKEWISETAKLIKVDLSRSQKDYQSSSSQEEEKKSYLMIRVQPRDDGYYALTAWFGPKQQLIYPASIEDEQPIQIEHIEQIIQKLYARYISNTMEETVIEMFLPVELLDYASDRLKIKQGKRSLIALGEKYQLVSRSFDRIYDPEMRTTHRDWQKRWETWKRGLSQENIYPFGHRSHYLNNDFIRREEVSFLVFTCTPTEDERDELFWSMLDAGIPVALLPRKQHLHPTPIEHMLKVLCQHGYNLLPQRLRELRSKPLLMIKEGQENNIPENQADIHLTLLWDDPERLPPDVKSILH